MARPSPDGRRGPGAAPDHRSTGYEPFAVEHHRHDPPAESAEEQQRRGEADARASVAWITLNAMSHGTAIGGRLASALSCAAARTSVIRVEIAAPIQIGQPRRRRG
jgi:hypothetical protein